MSKNDIRATATSTNLFCGAWVRYVPDGEWGTALEVYDFLADGSYRIIVSILPKSGRAETLPTALTLTGHYALKDDAVVFKTDDGVEKSRKFEIQGEVLFLKGERDEISILRRVSDSDVPASRASE